MFSLFHSFRTVCNILLLTCCLWQMHLTWLALQKCTQYLWIFFQNVDAALHWQKCKGLILSDGSWCAWVPKISAIMWVTVLFSHNKEYVHLGLLENEFPWHVTMLMQLWSPWGGGTDAFHHKLHSEDNPLPHCWGSNNSLERQRRSVMSWLVYWSSCKIRISGQWQKHGWKMCFQQNRVFILGKAGDHIEYNLSWPQMIWRWYDSFWGRSPMT